jgi:hypothetical protein
MDPPYGVKFGSNFQPFVCKRDVKHNDDDDMTREPEMGVPRPRNDGGAAHRRRKQAVPSDGALGRVGLSPSASRPAAASDVLRCNSSARPRFARRACGVSASPAHAEVRVGCRVSGCRSRLPTFGRNSAST